MLKKIISTFTLACFLVSFVFGEVLRASVPPQNIRSEFAARTNAYEDVIIPQGYGRITDAWLRESKNGTPAERGLIVVNLQTLHCHPEVQKNISNILGVLDGKYGLKNVYVEGACGQVDTSWLCGITNGNNKKKVMDSLLNAGRLTGSEYYSAEANRPDLLRGIEDAGIHGGNIVRLGRILQKEADHERFLKAMDKDLAFMKAKYLSAENLALNDLIETHRAGKIPSYKYYWKLGNYADRINRNPEKYNAVFEIRMGKYPNMGRYIEQMKVSKKLNYKMITRQLGGFVTALKNALPYSEYAKLLENTHNFTKTDLLYTYLGQISQRPDIKPQCEANFSELYRFFAYMENSKNINPLALISEEKRLVSEIRMGVSKDAGELEVSFLIDFYTYFQDYLQAKLSSDDYEYFTERFDRFRALWNKRAFKDRLTELKEDFTVLDEYYRTNCARNECFLKNIPALNRVQSSESRVHSKSQDQLPILNIKDLTNNIDLQELLKNSDIVVIVTGGFHTEGLSRIFKERNISYLTITPSVTKDTLYSGIVYERLALEQAKALSTKAPAEQNALSSDDKRASLHVTPDGLRSEAMELRMISQGNIRSVDVDPQGKMLIVFADGKKLVLGSDMSAELEKENTLNKLKESFARISLESIADEATGKSMRTFELLMDSIRIDGAMSEIYTLVIGAVYAFAENNMFSGYFSGSGLTYDLSELYSAGVLKIDGMDMEIIARLKEHLQTAIYTRYKRHKAFKRINRTLSLFINGSLERIALGSGIFIPPESDEKGALPVAENTQNIGAVKNDDLSSIAAAPSAEELAEKLLKYGKVDITANNDPSITFNFTCIFLDKPDRMTIEVRVNGEKIGHVDSFINNIGIGFKKEENNALEVYEPYRQLYRDVGRVLMALALGVCKVRRAADVFKIYGVTDANAIEFYKSIGCQHQIYTTFAFDLKSTGLPKTDIEVVKKGQPKIAKLGSLELVKNTVESGSIPDYEKGFIKGLRKTAAVYMREYLRNITDYFNRTPHLLSPTDGMINKKFNPGTEVYIKTQGTVPVEPATDNISNQTTTGQSLSGEKLIADLIKNGKIEITATDNPNKVFTFTYTTLDKPEKSTIEVSIDGIKIGYVDSMQTQIKRAFNKEEYEAIQVYEPHRELYRGVGRVLMALVLAESKIKGNSKFYAVAIANENALKFYEAIGFRRMNRALCVFDLTATPLPKTDIYVGKPKLNVDEEQQKQLVQPDEIARIRFNGMGEALKQAEIARQERSIFYAHIGAAITDAHGALKGKGWNRLEHQLHAEYFAVIDAIEIALKDKKYNEPGNVEIQARLLARIDALRARSRIYTGEKELNKLFSDSAVELSQIVGEINSVLGRDIFENCTLYVTMESCTKCPQLIIGVGIKHVVFGAPAANPANSGLDILEKAGVDVVKDVRTVECRAVSRFYMFAARQFSGIYSSFQKWSRARAAYKISQKDKVHIAANPQAFGVSATRWMYMLKDLLSGTASLLRKRIKVNEETLTRISMKITQMLMERLPDDASAIVPGYIYTARETSLSKAAALPIVTVRGYTDKGIMFIARGLWGYAAAEKDQQGKIRMIIVSEGFWKRYPALDSQLAIVRHEVGENNARLGRNTSFNAFMQEKNHVNASWYSNWIKSRPTEFVDEYHNFVRLKAEEISKGLTRAGPDEPNYAEEAKLIDDMEQAVLDINLYSVGRAPLSTSSQTALPLPLAIVDQIVLAFPGVTIVEKLSDLTGKTAQTLIESNELIVHRTIEEDGFIWSPGAIQALDLGVPANDIKGSEEKFFALGMPVGLEVETIQYLEEIPEEFGFKYQQRGEYETQMDPSWSYQPQLDMLDHMISNGLEKEKINSVQVNIGIPLEHFPADYGELIDDARYLMFASALAWASDERINEKKTGKVASFTSQNVQDLKVRAMDGSLKTANFKRLEYGFADKENLEKIAPALQLLTYLIYNHYAGQDRILDELYRSGFHELRSLVDSVIEDVNNSLKNQLKMNIEDAHSQRHIIEWRKTKGAKKRQEITEKLEKLLAKVSDIISKDDALKTDNNQPYLGVNGPRQIQNVLSALKALKSLNPGHSALISALTDASIKISQKIVMLLTGKGLDGETREWLAIEDVTMRTGVMQGKSRLAITYKNILDKLRTDGKINDFLKNVGIRDIEVWRTPYAAYGKYAYTLATVDNRGLEEGNYLVIAEPLMQALLYKSPAEQERLLLALISHEVDEWYALNRETHSLYRDLGRFISWYNEQPGQKYDVPLGRDSRAFHEYLDYIVTLAKIKKQTFAIENTGLISRAPEQTDLLEFAQRAVDRLLKTKKFPAQDENLLSSYCKALLVYFKAVEKLVVLRKSEQALGQSESDYVAGERQRIINGLKTLIDDKYSSGRFTRYRKGVETVNRQIEKALTLIHNGNEPAAENILATLIFDYIRPFLSDAEAERRRLYVDLNIPAVKRSGEGYRVTQYRYIVPPGGENPMPVLDKSDHDTLWEAAAAMDNTIDGNLAEARLMHGLSLKLSEAIKIISAGEKDGIISHNETERADVKNTIDQALAVLPSSPRKSAKIDAKGWLEEAHNELENGRFKTAISYIDAARLALTEREIDTKRIVRNLQAGKLNALRFYGKEYDRKALKQIDSAIYHFNWALAQRRTKEFEKERDKAIKALYIIFSIIGRKNHEAPEYRDVGGIINEENGLLDNIRRQDRDGAIRLFAQLRMLAWDAAIIKDLAAAYRDLVVEEELKAIETMAPVDRDKLLDKTIEAFAADKKYERIFDQEYVVDSGKKEVKKNVFALKNKAIWRAKLYQAVNVSLKIGDPKHPKEKISNPAFDAILTYIKILQFDSVDDVLERKQIVKYFGEHIDGNGKARQVGLFETRGFIKTLKYNADNNYRFKENGREIVAKVIKNRNLPELVNRIIADYKKYYGLDEAGAEQVRGVLSKITVKVNPEEKKSPGQEPDAKKRTADMLSSVAVSFGLGEIAETEKIAENPAGSLVYKLKTADGNSYFIKRMRPDRFKSPKAAEEVLSYLIYLKQNGTPIPIIHKKNKKGAEPGDYYAEILNNNGQPEYYTVEASDETGIEILRENASDDILYRIGEFIGRVHTLSRKYKGNISALQGMGLLTAENELQAILGYDWAKTKNILDDKQYKAVRKAIEIINDYKSKPIQEPRMPINTDFNISNFRFDKDGNIQTVFDWDQSRMGYSFEDIHAFLTRTGKGRQYFEKNVFVNNLQVILRGYFTAYGAPMPMGYEKMVCDQLLVDILFTFHRIVLSQDIPDTEKSKNSYRFTNEIESILDGSEVLLKSKNNLGRKTSSDNGQFSLELMTNNTFRDYLIKFYGLALDYSKYSDIDKGSAAKAIPDLAKLTKPEKETLGARAYISFKKETPEAQEAIRKKAAVWGAPLTELGSLNTAAEGGEGSLEYYDFVDSHKPLWMDPEIWKASAGRSAREAGVSFIIDAIAEIRTWNVTGIDTLPSIISAGVANLTTVWFSKSKGANAPNLDEFDIKTTIDSVIFEYYLVNKNLPLNILVRNLANIAAHAAWNLTHDTDSQLMINEPPVSAQTRDMKTQVDKRDLKGIYAALKQHFESMPEISIVLSDGIKRKFKPEVKPDGPLMSVSLKGTGKYADCELTGILRYFLRFDSSGTLIFESGYKTKRVFATIQGETRLESLENQGIIKYLFSAFRCLPEGTMEDEGIDNKITVNYILDNVTLNENGDTLYFEGKKVNDDNDVANILSKTQTHKIRGYAGFTGNPQFSLKDGFGREKRGLEALKDYVINNKTSRSDFSVVFGYITTKVNGGIENEYVSVESAGAAKGTIERLVGNELPGQLPDLKILAEKGDIRGIYSALKQHFEALPEFSVVLPDGTSRKFKPEANLRTLPSGLEEMVVSLSGVGNASNYKLKEILTFNFRRDTSGNLIFESGIDTQKVSAEINGKVAELSLENQGIIRYLFPVFRLLPEGTIEEEIVQNRNDIGSILKNVKYNENEDNLYFEGRKVNDDNDVTKILSRTQTFTFSGRYAGFTDSPQFMTKDGFNGEKRGLEALKDYVYNNRDLDPDERGVFYYITGKNNGIVNSENAFDHSFVKPGISAIMPENIAMVNRMAMNGKSSLWIALNVFRNEMMSQNFAPGSFIKAHKDKRGAIKVVKAGAVGAAAKIALSSAILLIAAVSSGYSLGTLFGIISLKAVLIFVGALIAARALASGGTQIYIDTPFITRSGLKDAVKNLGAAAMDSSGKIHARIYIWDEIVPEEYLKQWKWKNTGLKAGDNTIWSTTEPGVMVMFAKGTDAETVAENLTWAVAENDNMPASKDAVNRLKELIEGVISVKDLSSAVFKPGLIITNETEKDVTYNNGSMLVSVRKFKDKDGNYLSSNEISGLCGDLMMIRDAEAGVAMPDNKFINLDTVTDIKNFESYLNAFKKIGNGRMIVSPKVLNGISLKKVNKMAELAKKSGVKIYWDTRITEDKNIYENRAELKAFAGYAGPYYAGGSVRDSDCRIYDTDTNSEITVKGVELVNSAEALEKALKENPNEAKMLNVSLLERLIADGGERSIVDGFAITELLKSSILKLYCPQVHTGEYEIKVAGAWKKDRLPAMPEGSDTEILKKMVTENAPADAIIKEMGIAGDENHSVNMYLSKLADDVKGAPDKEADLSMLKASFLKGIVIEMLYHRELASAGKENGLANKDHERLLKERVLALRADEAAEREISVYVSEFSDKIGLQPGTKALASLETEIGRQVAFEQQRNGVEKLKTTRLIQKLILLGEEKIPSAKVTEAVSFTPASIDAMLEAG